ncbi:hypothetical protein [Bremerella cremea]|uniref:hypothetical protein n=1 Tax=Bremerella cremea TaxID=1031537 RepID=UPI0031F01229
MAIFLISQGCGLLALCILVNFWCALKVGSDLDDNRALGAAMHASFVTGNWAANFGAGWSRMDEPEMLFTMVTWTTALGTFGGTLVLASLLWDYLF